MLSQKPLELDEEDLLLNEPSSTTVDLGDIDEDELLNEGLDTKTSGPKSFTEEELLFSDDDQADHPAPKVEVSFSKDDELDYDEEILQIHDSVKEQEPPAQARPDSLTSSDAIEKDDKQQKPRITAPSPLAEEKASAQTSAPTAQRSRPPQGPKVHFNPNFHARNVIRPANPMPPLLMRMPQPQSSNPVLNVANSIIRSQMANMPNMGGALRPRGPVPLMSLQTAPQPMYAARPPMQVQNPSFMGMPMRPNPQFGGPLTPMVGMATAPPQQRLPYQPRPQPVQPGPSGRQQPDWNNDVNQFLMKLNQPAAAAAPTAPVSLLSMMTTQRSRSPRRDRYRTRQRGTHSSRHRRRRSSSRSRSRSRTRSQSSSRSYSRTPSSYSSSSRSRSRSRSPRDRNFRSQVNVQPQPERDPGGYIPKNRRGNTGGGRYENTRQNQHLESMGVDNEYLSKLEEQKRLREQMLKKKEQRRHESRTSPGPSSSRGHTRRDPPPQDPLPTDDKKGGRLGRAKAYLVVVVDNVEKWSAAQPTISAIASATGRIKKCWQSTPSTVSIVFHEHDNAKQFMINQNGKVYGGCRLAIRLEKAYLNLATV